NVCERLQVRTLMEPFEYAVKKDVRNNPIVREVDEARQRELWRSVGVTGFLVVVLLFSAWQHFELLRHGYQVEEIQRERAAEEEATRQLRLEIETLKSPVRIEALATQKLHLVVATCCFAVWAAAIEVKLVYLQVFRHADLVARAEKQQMRTREAPPKRGDIVDRKGRVLATSVDADSIYAVPSEIGNPDEVMAKLCAALGDCNGKERQTLLDRLRKQGAFAFVRRQVSPDEAR